jgi:hypothetical protein
MSGFKNFRVSRPYDIRITKALIPWLLSKTDVITEEDRERLCELMTWANARDIPQQDSPVLQEENDVEVNHHAFCLNIFNRAVFARCSALCCTLCYTLCCSD